MGDGNLFRGTNIDQDSRFSDKQKKLLRAMRFDPSLSAKVNMENVNLDVVKPWIHKRITELLGGIEDEVLIAYIFELLEASKHPDPKELQIAVTGFLNGKNARVFMGELWSHLVSAQESVGGVPAAFLEKKKEEIRKRKQEQERIQERLGKTQSVEADSTAPDPDERETRNSVLLAARKAEIVVRSIKAEEASSRYIMPIPTTIEMEIATPNQQMTEQKQIRKSLTGYLNSPAATPAGRDNKAGWYAEHEKYLEISRTSSAGVLLIGDSLISGLARYPRIWNKYFQPLKALNFGIGGDRTQHVLWRVENGEIPQNTQMVVIHVGTNNTDRDEPKDIANGISSIAMIFQEAKPNCKVIITGLLPRDLEPSFRREKITKVNKYLKHFCASGHIRNFFYLKPDDDWVKADGTLDTRFYFQDFLHLVEEGDEKFASSIYKMITKVFGGQPVECEDTDVSDDDLAVTTTKTPAIPIPRSRSRSRSGSHPKLVGRSRHSPSNSPRLSPSPRRRRRRSSRSPPRRRSRSPRRHGKRRSFTRSRSRSRSRTPRRRIRSQSGSPSRSPAPAAVVLHDHRKDSSPRRRRVFKEDGANKVVEIKPADEGLLKGDTSDEVEAAKPALSPTQYSKSDKTQTRTYRRQHSESEGSPEPEGPVLAPGFKSGEQSDHRRSRDAKKETVRPRDRDAERRRDSRDSIRAKERDAGQRKTSRSGDRKDSPRRKSPPRRRESPKRDMSPRRKRSPHREEGVRSSNDYQPNPRDSRPPGALKRRAPTFSPSPERKARRSPVPPARRESPIRKRARRGSSDEEAASAKRPRPQESGSEVDTPPDVTRRREDKKKRDGELKPDKRPTDESVGKRRARNASQSFSPSEGEAETREQMVEAARRRVARKSSESAESSAEEEPRRKVIIRKQDSEESAEDRPRKQQSASKRRDAKPNTESESSDKEPERNARPTKDRIEVSVKGKPARVAAKSESSSGDDDDDDESDQASRRRVVVTKSSKEAVPSESEDEESDEEVRQEKIASKNPKTDREVRRRREESESVERAVQRKQSSRDKDKQQQQVRRKERAPARQEDASSEEERESERTAKRSPRKKVAQARQRSASRDESPEQLPEDAPPSDDDNEGEGDSCGRDEVDDRKKGKAEREEAADEGEEVEDSVEESPDRSQKTKKRKRSDREKSARGERARPRPRESTKSNRKSKKRRRHTDGSDEDSGESDMEVKLREQALKSMKAKRGSSGESSD